MMGFSIAGRAPVSPSLLQLSMVAVGLSAFQLSNYNYNIKSISPVKQLAKP